MITLEHESLSFSFPKVHPNATCSLNFQRTLRIPDDGNDHFLPPGLGSFPLRHLDDFVQRLPASWQRRGGVVMPMHQAEAMWINFDSPNGYPIALKIATGKICAISGEEWLNHLNHDPQDYVVLPEQPWLDGYCVEKGIIRQFVAMPFGSGYSVEEQLTGDAEHGGLQIVAYPMKADRYAELVAEQCDEFVVHAVVPMGLAPGGRMGQEIYDDEFGLDAWDQRNASRCFVTIANATQWLAITGQAAPTRPPTAKDYTNAGLPWFDYFAADAKAVEGADKLKGIKSVDEMAGQLGHTPPDDESIAGGPPVQLKDSRPRPVREYPG